MVVQGARIAVLGAGGAIGGHVVRGLLDAGYAVTAVVRSLTSAVRIGRYDIQIEQYDIAKCDAEALVARLDNCSAIIDCTYSTLPDIDARIAENTMLAETICKVARLAEIKTIIHYGTISVYPRSSGAINEEVVCSPQGDPYGDSKLVSEQVFLSHNAPDLKVTVLQLPVVIGPFMGWTASPAAQMSGGCILLPNDLNGVCSTIDVADVVHATLLCLNADSVAGERLLLHANCELNWAELYADYAQGYDVCACKLIDREEFVRLQAQHEMQRRPWQRLKQHFSDDGDFRQLLLAQWGIRNLYQRLRRTRGQAGMDRLKSKLKPTPEGAPVSQEKLMDANLVTLFDAMPAIRSDKANRLLGFSALHTYDETLKRCVQWLQWNGSGN